MERRLPSRKFPVVVLDALQVVQIGVVAAATDLKNVEKGHGDQLDADERKALHGWYRELDRVGREIGEILGR